MNTPYEPEDITAELTDDMVEHFQKIFLQVRPIIMDNAGSGSYTSKSDGSPVTATDTEVEQIILAEMKNQFPRMVVFGEESGYFDELPTACWLVDPIDGTASFIENIPAFTCMAVLIVDKQIMASIIYNPSTDEMFVARKNKGATKNGIRLQLSELPLPSKALCKGRFIPKLNEIMSKAEIECEIGATGAGFGFAKVADGSFAARFQLASQGQIHDYATGGLLILEAGGCIIPLDNSTYDYKCKSFVACHPALEKTIRANLTAIHRLE